MENITISDETKQLIKDFFNNTKDFCLSDYRKPENPTKAKVQDTYFQIIRKDNDWRNWRKIDFHFEVQFKFCIESSDNNSRAEDNIKSIYIFAHLETDKKTVKYFEDNSAHPTLYTTISTYYVLLGKRILANFSTKENTLKTLENIAEILRNGEFKHLGDLADSCQAVSGV
ncbi:MAG: hypothetical protein K2J37_05695 [Ruminococcus sp.]|nr:hypothetical protein [Ruminococcus sp.]MDE6785282.1 hypothetical protein [Ruminococcus sp.]